jgi:hypothetical protein
VRRLKRGLWSNQQPSHQILTNSTCCYRQTPMIHRLQTAMTFLYKTRFASQPNSLWLLVLCFRTSCLEWLSLQRGHPLHGFRGDWCWPTHWICCKSTAQLNTSWSKACNAQTSEQKWDSFTWKFWNTIMKKKFPFDNVI